MLLGGGVVLVQRIMDPGLAGPPRCTFTSAQGAAFDLDPQQARNASIISAVATRRQLPPRAAVLGVATAMQESKLHNLPGGDRDSLGLFQQRPSQGWGTKEQILDPVYSAGKFYDVLATINGWETMPLTKAAQAVQRSGFPDAYAQHETEAQTYGEALAGVRPISLGCRLKEAAPSATTSQVAAALKRETGTRADAVDGALVLQAGDARQAGTAAAWAVASAAEFGVTEVRLGGKAWRRGTSEESLAWVDTTEPAAPTAVRITLARR